MKFGKSIQYAESKPPTNSLSDKLFDKKIWTVTEAAAFLNRSVGTIYNLVSLGKLPFYKRGKRLYFIPQEILNWVQEGD